MDKFILCAFLFMSSYEGLCAKDVGFELPEVTVMGKDISEYETVDPFKGEPRSGQKEPIHFVETPGKERSGKQHTIKSASISAGRYGYFSSNADLAGSEIDLDYLLQFKYARADGYRDHSTEEMYRPKGALGLQLSPILRFSGEYGFFTKQMELPGRVDQTTANASRKNESTDFSLALEWDDPAGRFTDIRLFGSLARTEERVTQETLDSQFLGVSQSLSYDVLRLGADVWSERLQNFYSYQKWSLHGGVMGYGIREFLILDALMGVDYYEGMYPRTSVKSNLNWYLSDPCWIFLGINRKMVIRSWSESFLTEFYVEGNLEELRPQRDMGAEAGISYVLKEDCVTTLSLFMTQLKDMLVWQDLDLNGLYTLAGLDKVKLLGANWELETRILRALRATSRISVQSIQNDDPKEEEVPYLPKIKYEFSLDWSLTDHWIVGTSVSYKGSQFVDPSGEGQIQDYILWDMNSNYHWKHLTFFTKVLNVLDQRYDFYEGYPGPDTQYLLGVSLEY